MEFRDWYYWGATALRACRLLNLEVLESLSFEIGIIEERHALRAWRLLNLEVLEFLSFEIGIIGGAPRAKRVAPVNLEVLEFLSFEIGIIEGRHARSAWRLLGLGVFDMIKLSSSESPHTESDKFAIDDAGLV